MPKQEFDVQLILQGRALAYSEDEIRDNVVKNIRDVSDCMFGTSRMGHLLRIGEKEISSESVTREELVDILASQLFRWNAELQISMATYLENDLYQVLEEENGFFSYHAGTERAIGAVEKTVRFLYQNKNREFEKLDDVEKDRYREAARRIMQRSVWMNARTQLVLPLVEEKTNPEAEND